MKAEAWLVVKAKKGYPVKGRAPSPATQVFNNP